MCVANVKEIFRYSYSRFCVKHNGDYPGWAWYHQMEVLKSRTLPSCETLAQWLWRSKFLSQECLWEATCQTPRGRADPTQGALLRPLEEKPPRAWRGPNWRPWFCSGSWWELQFLTDRGRVSPSPRLLPAFSPHPLSSPFSFPYLPLFPSSFD